MDDGILVLDCVVGGNTVGSKEHGDGYNMQMGAIIHLLTRFERRH